MAESRNYKTFPRIGSIVISPFHQHGNFAVMSQVAEFAGIAIRSKHKLPDALKRRYSYQTGVRLTIALRCQHSQPLRLKGFLHIAAYYFGITHFWFVEWN
jgi:hypothetical protein